MLKKLTGALLFGASVASAFAQTFPNIQGNRPYSAYLEDARGIIVRSSFGLCWRTGFWTAADAVEGCDGVLAPPVAKVIAPPFVAKPDPTPVSAAVIAAAPAPVAAPTPAETATPIAEKINFAGDALFDSGKSELRPAGKAKLDELASKLRNIRVESILATGHTDSRGASASNLKLSMQRAESVKAYLASKGIDPKRIHTAGKGETQPVGNNKTAAGRAQNRRVELEIVGDRSKR
jgi:OOP family OmpA-OmpF porin